MSDDHNDFFLDEKTVTVLRRLAEDAKSNPGESITSHGARFEKLKKLWKNGCRQDSVKGGRAHSNTDQDFDAELLPQPF